MSLRQGLGHVEDSVDPRDVVDLTEISYSQVLYMTIFVDSMAAEAQFPVQGTDSVRCHPPASQYLCQGDPIVVLQHQIGNER